MFLLILSLLLFIVGYSVPFWGNAHGVRMSLVSELTISQATYTCDDGLWVLCVSATSLTVNSSSCGEKGVWGVAWWMHVVRALECVCLVGIGTACVYAFVVNLCSIIPGPRSRFIEFVTLCSCLSGLIGAGMYVILIGKNNDNNNHDTNENNNTISIPNNISESFSTFNDSKFTWKISWAWYEVVAANNLALIAAGIIFIFNKDSIDNSEINTMTILTTMTISENIPAVVRDGNALFLVNGQEGNSVSDRADMKRNFSLTRTQDDKNNAYKRLVWTKGANAVMANGKGENLAESEKQLAELFVVQGTANQLNEGQTTDVKAANIDNYTNEFIPSGHRIPVESHTYTPVTTQDLTLSSHKEQNKG
ncbi:hypothetical protein V1264_000855 [Littorina saxatilis]|uniref:Transmembrane protein n=1 Tax=Littorina saxatilis TaxID=31220 RepID=A0AAN9GN74_9CAEN